MVLVLLISAILFTIVLLAALLNGWFSLIGIWICGTLILIALGYIAVLVIKPRFPEWWKQNIASDSIPEL